MNSKKLRFTPSGFTDGLSVTMPNGGILELTGDSVIGFTLSRFGRGGISVIELCGFCSTYPSKVLKIEKATGAKVFICDKE